MTLVVAVISAVLTACIVLLIVGRDKPTDNTYDLYCKCSTRKYH